MDNLPSTLALVYDHNDGSEILHVFGEIDLANAEELESAIVKVTNGNGRVVVDLSGCSYMDSSGLNVVAKAFRSFGERFRLVVPHNGSVHRIFDIAGFTEHLQVYDALDIALS